MTYVRGIHVIAQVPYCRARRGVVVSDRGKSIVYICPWSEKLGWYTYGTVGYHRSFLRADPLPPSEQRRSTSMQEDSLPKQEIQIVPAESWMDRPVKVHITTPTATGSTSQTVYLTIEEARELERQLSIHITPIAMDRAFRSGHERAMDGHPDGGRLG